MTFNKSHYDTEYFKRNTWNLKVNNKIYKSEQVRIKKIIEKEKIDLVFGVTTINIQAIESLKELDFNLISVRNVLKLDLDNNIKIKNNKPNFIINMNISIINLDDIKIFASSLKKTSRLYKDPILKKYSQDYYEKWLFNSINKKFNDNYFAFYKDILAGILLIKYNQRIPRIELISVNPKFQHIGIGTFLLNYAIKNLVKEKKESLLVGTLADNINAIKFYENNGFRTIDSELLYHKHII